MKRLAFLCLVMLMLAAIASADQYAETSDGRRVLLRDDGTWEYVPETPDDAQVDVELTRFRWTESGPANDYANDFTDWFAQTYRITNKTDRAIRALRGVVILRDLFGDELYRIRSTFNGSIPPNESQTFNMKFDYGMFNDSHRRLKPYNENDLEIDFVDVEILFVED